LNEIASLAPLLAERRVYTNKVQTGSLSDPAPIRSNLLAQAKLSASVFSADTQDSHNQA
jgi:hypothetical protein